MRPVLCIIVMLTTMGAPFSPAAPLGHVDELLGSVRGRKHPYLLGPLERACGWKGKDKKPWCDFWENIRRAAKADKAVVFFIRGPATGAIVHAGGRAHEGEVMPDPSISGLLWRSTKRTGWLKKAELELESLTPRFGKDGRTGETEVLARFLIRYSLLFDLVAEDLEPGKRSVVSKKLAAFAHTAAAEYMRSRNAHRRIMLGSALGVASLALANEKDVADRDLRSWLKLATVGLFEDDPHGWADGLKPYLPRGALGGVVDPAGYCRIGGYRSYWTGLLAKWLLVYFLATGRNPFDDCPISRTMLEPLWLSMPNRMSPQQNTRLGYFEHDFLILWPLMTEGERSALSWYLKPDPAVPHRPRFTYGDVWNGPFWALFYPPPLPQGNVPWRSFYDPRGEVCIFRRDWRRDALWLAFYAFYYPIPSHREMCHNDNMSFEMFAFGDYLLCDPGEVKGRMRGYGPVMGHGHNICLIDGLGPAKEDITQRYFKFVSPARFTSVLLCDWFEAAAAEMTVRATEFDPVEVVKRTGRRAFTAKRLESPVVWRRAVLFPQRRYFVIVDRLKCECPHDISLLLHLSSLNYKPTVRGVAGYVRGELLVGGRPVDWRRGESLNAARQWIWLEEKRVRALDANWRTTNIYSEKVWLRIVSVPQGNLRIGRMWGHIPQSRFAKGESAEVDHPLLAVGNKAVKSLWRITLLYPTQKQPPSLHYAFKDLGEQGLVLVFERDRGRDFVFAGEGGFQGFRFSGFCGFMRVKGEKVISAGALGCRLLQYGGGRIFECGKPVEGVALRFAPEPSACFVSSESAVVRTGLPQTEAQLSELPASTYLLMRTKWRPKNARVGSADSFRVPAGTWALR